MPIRNVSHIAIGVRDMDTVLPFWTDVVGLHVTLDTEERFTICLLYTSDAADE